MYLDGGIPNGCGNAQSAPLFNSFLQKLGESNLITCCNDHDTCYGQCQLRDECDLKFKACIIENCNGMNWFDGLLCHDLASTMHSIVRKKGQIYWCKLYK